MNLKEFISTTLVEIAEGIKDAQGKYKKFGGAVNPAGIGPSCTTGENVLYDIKNRPGSSEFSFPLSTIEFEVGLTSNTGTEDRGGLGVFLASVGVGTSTKETEQVASITKVKFSIPVKLPTQYL